MTHPQTPDADAAAIRRAQLRLVIGQYPTGVAVITGMSTDGQPLGMVVGSFSRVSSDPPLVSFMPGRTAGAWIALREAGDRFCVNILSEHQEDVAGQIASRRENRFEGIPYSLSEGGLPVIHGALGYIDCVTEQIVEAGDHDIVIGRPESMQAMSAAYPLIFFRGGFGCFEPTTLVSNDHTIREQLKHVTRCSAEMERLADVAGTEVSAIIRDADEIVLGASVGRTPSGQIPIRVGQRLPFSPPFGSLDAALGGPELQEQWLRADRTSALSRAENEAVLDAVRERGYVIAYGHEAHRQIADAAAGLGKRDPGVREDLLDRLKDFDRDYNLTPSSDDVELRLITAPVFGSDGSLAFGLTLWGPSQPISPADVDRLVAETRASAQRCTELLAG